MDGMKGMERRDGWKVSKEGRKEGRKKTNERREGTNGGNERKE